MRAASFAALKAHFQYKKAYLKFINYWIEACRFATGTGGQVRRSKPGPDKECAELGIIRCRHNLLIASQEPMLFQFRGPE
ncbi:hypothetical protein Q644_14135 [Brucella intermedia 229E]|uniref:Uncharacterized protein n=1 Tax=Brucella intermedia 229E TaxID=1337887 RepID=U4VJE3_9HYPH|nr:hypothetical protein Q644_14135 [Brucella intermedia 229E]